MNDLILKAARGEPVARTPLWMMRQAGRYLPEYRAIRQKVDFLTLCHTPELACEVTLQPIRRFGFDAAILFSDIMVPLQSMGIKMDFAPGPIIEEPLRSEAQIEALALPATDAIAPAVMETVRLLRRELKVPLIGFAGAPLTLAAYLVEGKGSKDFSQLRALLYGAPQAAERLFALLADLVSRYVCAQVDAGAQMVQLFDSWAGILPARMYERFVLPGVRQIIEAVRSKGVPAVFFAQDAAALLPLMRQVPADVFGVDWRLELGDVADALGPQVTLQGNLDPAVLKSDPATVRFEVDRILSSMGARPHIFNLGHGIQPDTPIPNVEALVTSVAEISQQVRAAA